MAGEISHMVVDLDGEKCFCGKRGCIDTFASHYQIERKIAEQRERKQGEPFSFIIERAKLKMNPDFQVIQTAAKFVATGVVNVVQAVDIEAIILGGRTLLYEDSYFAKLVQTQIHQLLGDEIGRYL